MANIYRWTCTCSHPATGTLELMTMHFQTDVPIAGTEPSANTVLTQINQHFSSSGTNLSFIRNVMYSPLNVVKTAVRQEVEPGSGDVPATDEAFHGLDGSLSSSPYSLPLALCGWVQFHTGVALRSARGGTHLPSIMVPGQLDTDRTLLTSGSYWVNGTTLANQMADKLEDVFQTTGDINPGIYSRTRHARGQEPFFWELTGAAVRRVPAWLRRRESSP